MQIQGTNAGGTFTTTTEAQPALAQPHSELLDFYKELIRRRNMGAAGGMAPGQSNARVLPPPSDPGPSRDRNDPLAAARLNDEMQDLAYRQRLRQIDLNPPTKWIESRPGVQGGYAPDVTVLPLSLRPKQASVAYGAQDEARARGTLANNQAFQARLDADRRSSAAGY